MVVEIEREGERGPGREKGLQRVSFLLYLFLYMLNFYHCVLTVCVCLDCYCTQEIRNWS